LTRRTLLIAAAIAIVALLGLVFVRNLTDFSVYYAAGRSLISGRTDLYSPDFARGVVMDYRYLPFFILVFAPLSLLPYTFAAYVWHLLDTLAIVVAVVSIASIYRNGFSGRAKVWSVAFFTVAPYFAMALDYGNVQLIVTAMMFAGLSLALKRRDVPAAALLAIATAVKIVPALTLVYFAITRRFRLLGLVIVIIAALNLLPSVYFGIAGNTELVARWYDHVIRGQEFHETNGPINLSLKGQLRRTFTEVDYTRRVDGDYRYPAVNIATWPVSTIDRIWLVLSACSVLGGLGLIWWSSSKRRAGALRYADQGVPLEALQLGLLICLMLFVGPLTSKVYLVALLWPVVAVAMAARDQPLVRRVLVATALLSSALPLMPGRNIQRLLLVAGVDFYLSTVIFALVAFTLIRSTRARLRLRHVAGAAADKVATSEY
jgi:glycosyl transferase family 87